MSDIFLWIIFTVAKIKLEGSWYVYRNKWDHRKKRRVHDIISLDKGEIGAA